MSFPEDKIRNQDAVAASNEAEGYRGLTQHGGPPGWLEESDPAGVILY